MHVELLKRVENIAPKVEIDHYNQFLLFSSISQSQKSLCRGVLSVVSACFRKQLLVNAIQSSVLIVSRSNLYSNQISMRARFLSQTSHSAHARLDYVKILRIELVDTIQAPFRISPKLHSSQVSMRVWFLSQTSQIHPCKTGLWPMKSHPRRAQALMGLLFPNVFKICQRHLEASICGKG